MAGFSAEEARPAPQGGCVAVGAGLRAQPIFSNLARRSPSTSTASKDIACGRKCKQTEAIFQGRRVHRWVNVERLAVRKLEQLDWSSVPDDLRVPPGNQLEALKGIRKGQHSIRVNDQWRVSFVWMREGSKDVKIVDQY